MSGPAFRLINEFQRDFPLCRAPFEAIARRLGASESWVLEMLQAYRAQGVVSRVGAVFAPRSIGASVLAALAVPQADLEHVAERVGSHPEVNHNYEREHRYNLWFVATASSEEKLRAALRRIESEAGCGRMLVLPLIEEYRIDLGFDLRSDRGAPVLASTPRAVPLGEPEKRLVLNLQPGLALVNRPFAALADAAGWAEQEAMTIIEHWIAAGVIRRFGVILRHHELGYRANAMAAWDVPDSLVSVLGLRLAQQQGVTLCYRRERALPDWPYNLFCMIHGRGREAVSRRLRELRIDSGLAVFPSQVLFSRRRFKQHGARYFSAAEVAHV